MKKTYYTMMLTLTIGIMCLSASRSMQYTIRVIEAKKVVTEVKVPSHDVMDRTIDALSVKFPNADRIEIETKEQSIL
jgi:hypothetical protein